MRAAREHLHGGAKGGKKRGALVTALVKGLVPAPGGFDKHNKRMADMRAAREKAQEQADLRAGKLRRGPQLEGAAYHAVKGDRELLKQLTYRLMDDLLKCTGPR